MAAVKAESLENAERDIEIMNRETKGGKATASEPAAQLVALRQRIRRGLNEVGDDPRPKDAPSCRECFQRGWLAAMRSLQE
jgi:hypothetical protein